ncbi:sodium- and chloride-dependent glycine transporter 2-like [Ylistrum balloti]|uniref:sodium- and chloride-dependent glycine transporter 2-like n=1 Tax=Ylistrum balloti TaxID=509963 RepID=UPI002905E146|nr:sodium- and chloride-dependent glycine transporter 2-like [Ylistrum balloti]
MQTLKTESKELDEMEKCENDPLTDFPEAEVGSEREFWSNKAESLLSLIGYCVGLGNIWRFPYFCMRNGGGSFLIAFLVFLIICGLPMYFVDMAIGQFTGRTALHAWELCPLLKGIGAGVLLVLVIISSYYTIIIAWTLFYLGNSFLSPLPWRTCDNKWNTDNCITERSLLVQVISSSNVTEYGHPTSGINTTGKGLTNISGSAENFGNLSATSMKRFTSEEEFWQRGLLEISSGLHEIGGIPWHLAVCYLAAWIILFLCLVKGIRSSGKVVYVTAVLPYILLTVLLIRALLLPGAKDGILFYITPQFQRLGDLQVWLEAALQVFYSLCPAWGPIITLASYNKFNNNFYRDSILLTFICEGTSIFGGFVVFAVIGFMAEKTGMTIPEVVTSGPGLVFMAYPEALAQLPLPNLWSVIFFLMLLSIGLDTQFSHMETIVTALLDQFPSLRRKRTIIHALVCLIWCIFGLVLCSQGGMYVFQLMDWYIGLSIPVFGFIELLIIGWIYGTERFSLDVTMMIGFGIPVIMRIAIIFVAPAALLFVFVFAFGTYEAPSYGAYKYPSYATAVGIVIGVVPLVPVVVMACVAYRNSKGSTFLERIADACKPSQQWKPASKKHAQHYTYPKLPEYNTLWSRLKLNILGANSIEK